MTLEELRTIKTLLDSGVLFKKIAKLVGFGKSHIANIAHGKSWKGIN